MFFPFFQRKKILRDSSLLCRLSDPAQPHKLSIVSSSFDEFQESCYSCHCGVPDGLHCDTCDLEFHATCHFAMPNIKHPFHPSHPLTLILTPTFDYSMISEWWNSVTLSSLSDSVKHNFVGVFDAAADDNDVSLSDGNHKCKCCRRRLQKAYYHCSDCNFNLNLSCSLQLPAPTISHTKSHNHPFNLFPVRVSSPCDACGLSLDDTEDLVYTCVPCSHMIHKSCIYLPRVIKITRHRHRLSFTSSLVSGDLICGVCRRKVDSNYGRYFCHTGCQYAVHSKCATREDVWDGIDLEGVAEEPEEDIEPYVRIDEETIRHFSHEHDLKLQEKKIICEKSKFCEACSIPLRVSQRFYGCRQCDFVLDEACAALPRKNYHPLHKHPLTLHPFPTDVRPWTRRYKKSKITVEGIFKCNGCNIKSCGFQYKCDENDCEFELDVRCAALPDPFVNGCHPQDHPLFFNLTKGKCMVCGSKECSSYFVECIECKSFLGLRCATLPSVLHYKHDMHPLTLCYGEEDATIGQYWCEICEGKLDSETWFYTCDPCRITVHLVCLLGKQMYLKPNHIIKVRGYEVKIALNDGNSRPDCWNCFRRCEEIFVFDGVDIGHTCTPRCMRSYYFQRVRRRT